MSAQADRRAANRLFVFSVSYLSLLFAALLLDGGSQASFPAAPLLLSRDANSAHDL